jgi:hypothetical protein
LWVSLTHLGGRMGYRSIRIDSLKQVAAEEFLP